MAKSSSELLKKAQELITQAKKIEAQEAKKIGKLVLKLFNENKISDTELVKKIKETLTGESKTKNVADDKSQISN